MFFLPSCRCERQLLSSLAPRPCLADDPHLYHRQSFLIWFLSHLSMSSFPFISLWAAFTYYICFLCSSPSTLSSVAMQEGKNIAWQYSRGWAGKKRYREQIFLRLSLGLKGMEEIDVINHASYFKFPFKLKKNPNPLRKGFTENVGHTVYI